MFFTSLIPQFVQPGPHAVAESAVLGSIFVVKTLAWLSGYSWLAAAVSDPLRRPAVRRAVDAVTGVALIGLGARLAIERR